MKNIPDLTKITCSRYGASNVVGTTMILMFSVLLISGIYLMVLNESTNYRKDAPASVKIIGSIEDGQYVVLEHVGGENLPLNTKISFTIFNRYINTNLSELEKQSEFWDGDDEWEVGEKVRYDNEDSLKKNYVSVFVTDPKTESIVMQGVIQQGKKGDEPYVITQGFTSKNDSSVNLTLYYDFIDQNPLSISKVRFRYREKDSYDPWDYTSWFDPTSSNGNYSKLIDEYHGEDLDFTKKYEYEGILNWEYIIDGISHLDYGGIKVFTTLSSMRGRWLFDDFSSFNIAEDTSENENKGYLKPVSGNPKDNGPNWLLSGGTIEPIQGDAALSFDGIDDYVLVRGDDSLQFTEELTIETWVRPLDHYQGYEAEFGEEPDQDFKYFGWKDIRCKKPHMINISEKNDYTIYAIVSGNYSDEGHLMTVKVFHNGTIKHIDSFERVVYDYHIFEDSYCYEPRIIHVVGDCYAVIYKGDNSKGIVKTIEIDSDGNIIGNLQSLEFSSSLIGDIEIIKINGWPNKFVITYTRNSDNLGCVSIIEIDSTNGIITELMDQDIDNSLSEHMKQIDIVHVIGNYYALAYLGTGSDGYILTLEIKDDGGWQINTINNINHDSYDGQFPDIVKISWDGIEGEGIFAIAYGSSANEQYSEVIGQVKTIKINDQGIITTVFPHSNNKIIIEALIDRFYSPQLFHLGGEYYGVFYKRSEPDNYPRYLRLRTITINAAGEITDLSDSGTDVQLSDSYCDAHCVNFLSNYGSDGCLFSIVHNGYGNSGYLKTIRIKNGKIMKGLQDEFGEHQNNDVDIHDLGLIRAWETKIERVISNENIFAIFYKGENDDGYVVTVETDLSGQITNIIDIFEFEPFQAFYINLLKISENEAGQYSIFAVSYLNNSATWINTIKINYDGTIDSEYEDDTNKYRIYIYEDDRDTEYDSVIRHFKNEIYMTYSADLISWGPKRTRGYLKTIEIDQLTGEIREISSISPSDSEFKLENVFSGHCDMAYLGNNLFAICYKGDQDEEEYVGYLATVYVHDNGTIDEGSLNRIEFDSTYADRINMLKINENIVAICYENKYGESLDNGMLRTFYINNDPTNPETFGTIISTPVDELRYSSIVRTLDFEHLFDDIYLITYSGNGYDAYICTLRIGSDGSLSDRVKSVYEYHGSYTSVYFDISPTNVQNFPEKEENLVISFAGNTYFLSLQTLNISFNSKKERILEKDGAWGIYADEKILYFYINSADFNISFNDINSTITEPSKKWGFDKWNHFAMIYYRNSHGFVDTLKFFVNGVDVFSEQNVLNGEDIFTKPVDLNIGRYNCVLDKTVLYSIAKNPTWVQLHSDPIEVDII